MGSKILIVPDIHLKARDVSTIRGYVANATENVRRLTKYVSSNGFTHVFLLGDVFDRGYDADLSKTFSHISLMESLAEAVNGNLYGVIGNHIRLKLDTNPELYLIQPHKELVTREVVERKEQIIKTPDRLVLNGCEFLFMHHKKYAKTAMDYRPIIDQGCRYHIGLYHTDLVIPNDKLSDNPALLSTSTSSTIMQALDQIDYAFVGHIHTPLGAFKVGRTTMYVPGSLNNTTASERTRHDICKLPIVSISDDGEISISQYDFDMHLEEVVFSKVADKDARADKLRLLRGNNQAELYDDLILASIDTEHAFMTLPNYMRTKGYTASDVRAVTSVIDAPEDLTNVMSIYREEENLE